MEWTKCPKCLSYAKKVGIDSGMEDREMLSELMYDYADRTGIPRVTIVSLALDQYLMQEEAKRKMIADMGDPVKLAEIYRVLGLPMPGDKRTKLL